MTTSTLAELKDLNKFRLLTVVFEPMLTIIGLIYFFCSYYVDGKLLCTSYVESDGDDITLYLKMED